MAVFSVTDRNTFKRCRRQWDFSSNARQNLTKLGSGPEPLELGGLIHRALADWLLLDRDNPKEARNPGVLGHLFLQVAASRQKELTEDYEKVWGAVGIPPTYLTSLHDVVQLGFNMMVNYQTFYKQPLPDDMHFALPEQEIEIPVAGTEFPCANLAPDCSDCNGTGIGQHKLRLTMDGLVQNNKGWLFILEHKTFENRPRPMDLYMNDQFTGYTWGGTQLKIGHVQGLLYDGMWKRHEPPKYMQKEKRKGVLEDLFIRKIINKTADCVEEWGRYLPLELNEMANNPEIYPHVPWSGCNDCSFQDVCYLIMQGDDVSFKLSREFTQRKIIRGGKGN